MKKRSTNLLALAICVSMLGSSLSPVLAANESPAPTAEAQTEGTADPDVTTVSDEAADSDATTDSDAAVDSDETTVSDETVDSDEPAAPTETAEPAETAETDEEAEIIAASEGTAKDIVDARTAEGGPKANLAYYAQDVTFETATADDGKTVTILKIDGSVPAESAEMIVGVVNEDNSVTYYAYAPSGKGWPEGAICQDDVYKLSAAGIYYAFDEHGRMIISGTYVYKSSANKNTFYFQKNGQKKSVSEPGYYKVEGTYYYLTASGAIKTSVNKFKEIGGEKYYFEAGVMKTSSFVTVGSYLYYLDKDGHMVTGRQKIDGNFYYFRTAKEAKGKRVGSALSGWHLRDGWWYYYMPETFKGATGYGIVKLAKNSYYFYPNGRAYKKGGKLKNKYTNNKAYYFKKQTDTEKPYMLKNTWISSGKKWYYALSNGQLATGKQKITQKAGRSDFTSGTYYFDENSCKMLKNMNAPDGSGWLDETGRLITKGWFKSNGNWRYLSNGSFVKNGFKKIDGYYYYFKGGYLCQDLRKMFKGTSGTDYQITVNRKTCNVTVFTRSTFNDETKGKFVVPVVMFRSSVGLPGTPTPTGSYRTWRAADGRWKLLMGPSWGQYGMGVVNGILFHSVSGPEPNRHDCVPRAQYNRLGAPASHGCIRLCVNDAKWIWDNANGAYVYIFDSTSDTTKFSRPPAVPMKGSGTYGVDPTDPAVAGWVAPTHINPY